MDSMQPFFQPLAALPTELYTAIMNFLLYITFLLVFLLGGPVDCSLPAFCM